MSKLQEQRVSLTQVEQIEVLVGRIVILEDTIQMLSYNLRCLNIRHGSQPFELPNFQATPNVFIHEGLFDEATFNSMVKTDHKCTPDEFEFMQGNLKIEGTNGMVSDPDFNPKNITFDLSGIHALDCMNSIRGSVDDLILNEDRRYQDMVAFGADEVAWQK